MTSKRAMEKNEQGIHLKGQITKKGERKPDM